MNGERKVEHPPAARTLEETNQIIALWGYGPKWFDYEKQWKSWQTVSSRKTRIRPRLSYFHAGLEARRYSTLATASHARAASERFSVVRHFSSSSMSWGRSDSIFVRLFSICRMNTPSRK